MSKFTVFYSVDTSDELIIELALPGGSGGIPLRSIEVEARGVDDAKGKAREILEEGRFNVWD